MLILEGPPATVTALAFSPDGGELAVGTRDGTLAITAVYDGVFRELPEYARSVVNAIAFPPTGDWLYFGTADGLRGTSRSPFFSTLSTAFHGGRKPTTALAFLDRSTLAVGTGDRVKAEPGCFELIKIESGQRREPYFREPAGVRAVAVHSESFTVAWTNGDRRLSIWNTLVLEPRHVSLTHTSPSLSFQPDGERLAVALEWGVKLFDVASRDEKLSLKGHTGRVTCVAYHPAGHTLATASWDATVKLWDAAGDVRATFDWGIGKVHCLAFAPDGLRLAAGGENGRVAVWDLE